MPRGGDLSMAAINDMDRMVKNVETDLPGIGCMLWTTSMLSQAVGRMARWLAGCHCHQQLLGRCTFVQAASQGS